MTTFVLTGAAGRLGTQLRAPLAAMCDQLISSDIAPMEGDLLPNETFVEADLSDLAAITALTEGADMVIHFGAIVDEAPFDQILSLIHI